MNGESSLTAAGLEGRAPEPLGPAWSGPEVDALLAVLADLVLVVDACGVVLKASPEAPRFLCAGGRGLAGRPLEDILPAGLAARLRRAALFSVEGGRPHYVPFRLTVANGQVLDFEAKLAACGGGRVLVLLKDMTVFFKAERQRLEAERRAMDLAGETGETGEGAVS